MEDDKAKHTTEVIAMIEDLICDSDSNSMIKRA